MATLSKLAEAIAAGRKDAQAVQAREQKKAAAKQTAEEAESEARYQRYKRVLGDGVTLYALIRKFTRQDALAGGRSQVHELTRADLKALTGEDGSCCRELARAIETFPGVRADYSERMDYVNSDEIPELLTSIKLSWVRTAL